MRKEKIIKSVLIIWTFIHLYLFISSISQFPYKLSVFQNEEIVSFYPLHFSHRNDAWCNWNHYGLTEFFVYVGGAWLFFFLYRYLMSDISEYFQRKRDIEQPQQDFKKEVKEVVEKLNEKRVSFTFWRNFLTTKFIVSLIVAIITFHFFGMIYNPFEQYDIDFEIGNYTITISILWIITATVINYWLISIFSITKDDKIGD